MPSPSRCRVVFALPTIASALLLAGAPAARAEEGFSVEAFEPQPAQGRAILGLGTSQVLAHTQLALGLFGHYADDPLTVSTLSDRDTVVARLVDQRFTLEVLAGFGLFDILQIDLALPMVLSQSGDPLAAIGLPGQVDGFALGDLRFALRVRLVDTRPSPDEAGFGLALALPIGLPTGDAAQLTSDGGVRLRPTLALDYGDAAFRVALEVGYDLRPERAVAAYTSDDQLRWGLGGRVPLGVDMLRLVAHLQGTVGVASQAIDDTSTSPIELMGALELALADAGLVVTAGAGGALNRGVGSPDVRAFLAFGWLARAAPPVPPDGDGDGLTVDFDKCPDFPEDKDGFQDEDGCPDPDDDIDGIPDASDACPREAEDFKGPEDGCPQRDQDGDGVADGDDKCPSEAEDKDGDADADGCPDLDPDGDGVDPGDACPNEPEDKDGFQDGDGCPDLDDDGDGVPDVSDKCPALPESQNGFQDDDGCPDTTEKDVVLTGEAIQIKQSIFFAFSSDKIRDKSFPILDAVARVLAANPFIKKVSIEGHTDSEGPDAANLELSTRRAASVLAYLVEHGVAPERLASQGFGETQPLQPNTTPGGRAANRRVEFRIIDPAPRAP